MKHSPKTDIRNEVLAGLSSASPSTTTRPGFACCASRRGQRDPITVLGGAALHLE
jgi:predicted small integral membrane protein